MMGESVIEPYELLGIPREAGDAEIKAAYRRLAKSAHPDSGGDVDSFAQVKCAYELLKDPIRRKVYDETGYDPQLAEVKDLEGLLILEKVINDMVLDEREPGSFDPVALMRRKLTDEVVQARFHVFELERHRGRIRNHLDRISSRPMADVLGSMLRTRVTSITEAIEKAGKHVEAIERAYEMLEGYGYEIESVQAKAAE
ncbi:J domain-containing protein [Rhizobium sp. BK376]|jgi:curved DNA-binding protein CbpA|uniref:J domain-containing protein n=1 Tax=Rhizobium sp. BK376 TaxID=2512149 RepID=UPI00104A8924|nr:J domain-containing protein [Rhizobium sp. BK376]TCR92655.1 DnaJ-like protein [Rhizobium sp. BK376]